MSNPLILAVKAKESFTVRNILAAGGDPDDRDEHNETALTWAAHLGNTAIVKDLLAANADRDARGDLLDATPLLLAARGGYRGIVALLAVLADVDARTSRGATPLMLALAPSHEHPKSDQKIEAVVKILLNAEADLDLQDDTGHTALMWATRVRHLEGIRILLEAGANRDLKNVEGQTALDIADTGGDQELVQILKSRMMRPA